MKVLIHAVPKRMWYVEQFLAPSIEAQCLEPVIWCDREGYGNLESCLRSFEAGLADWHLQDDVLICRDFAAKTMDLTGVVCGFCHYHSRDDKTLVGKVYPPDMWHGFPCMRIPIEMAQDFVRWLKGTFHTDPMVIYHITRNTGDDYLFHEYFEAVHGHETATNISLVEHIDWLIGGAVVNDMRGYICRSDLWDDEPLVDELRARLKQLNLPP